LFGRILASLQAVYLIGTGLWAMVDIEMFQDVTGPKNDLWLVKTVAALLIVIGLVLGAGALRKRMVRETAMLGAATALALAAVDTIYGLGGDISGIYLAEGAVEAAVVAAWVVVWMRSPPE
jgi:uncharacterized membrane protein SirB2